METKTEKLLSGLGKRTSFPPSQVCGWHPGGWRESLAEWNLFSHFEIVSALPSPAVSLDPFPTRPAGQRDQKFVQQGVFGPHLAWVAGRPGVAQSKKIYTASP